jgi:photosystem II stability/assembly factor-like uncharacterized protein
VIFRSTDAGQSWTELRGFREIPGRRLWWSPAEPPWTAYVQAIAVSPDDPQVVLAGIEFGAVVRSDDGGSTWSRHLRGSLRDCHSLAFHHRDGNWAYEAGGSGGGASYSSDGGQTWSKARRGLDRKYAWACAADPQHPDTWYISAAPGPAKAHVPGQAEAYLYRWRNGSGWRRLGGGLPQPLHYMPYGLETVPGHPGHIIACLANGELWISDDHGDRWTKHSGVLGSIQRAFLAFETQPERSVT